MTDPSAAALEMTPVPAAKLEPDAIGVAQDTVIGMASSAPAASVGLTLAALAAASSDTRNGRSPPMPNSRPARTQGLARATVMGSSPG